MRQPRSAKYLHDMIAAADLLLQFLEGKGHEDYCSDALLRAGVERQFEIIGEALHHMLRIDSNTATRISNHRRIIDFRNVPIHGYAVVDDRIVWDIAQDMLPVLYTEAKLLLAEITSQPEG